MKFCYCDESGTGDEPIAVMVGIIVDASRMHVTKGDWQALLTQLSRVVEKPITELHTRDFYSGNGPWRGLPGPKRAEIITEILAWLASRKHQVVFVGIKKDEYHKSQKAGQIPKETNTLWKFMGLHLMLAVQKAHQRHAKNKGHTVFVFDNEEKERMRFTELVNDPPAWTDSYYQKGKKQDRLDQVVDVPYFGDSQEVHLLQVADFVAYFLRRHAEITEGLVQERYSDEASIVGKWVGNIQSTSLETRHTYPATGRCDCADLFHSHASATIRSL